MRIRMSVLSLILLLTGLLAAACVAGQPGMPVQPMNTAPTPEPGKVTLLDVRGRPGILAGGTSAVYLTILNGLDHDVQLVGAVSPAAAVVEIHETVNDNGVMRMNPLPDGILVPAQQAVELMPGGKHIMLIDLAAPLMVGDQFPITFKFATGETISVTVPVMEISGGMMMPDHGGAAESTSAAMDDSADTDAAHADTHEHTHDSMPDAPHEHAPTGPFSAEIQAAVAALPIYEIHDLDDALMAGTVKPEAIPLVDEFLAGLAGVTWPEELHELIDALTLAATELRIALVEGDTAKAAELVEHLHDQAHELEFQVQQSSH